MTNPRRERTIGLFQQQREFGWQIQISEKKSDVVVVLVLFLLLVVVDDFCLLLMIFVC